MVPKVFFFILVLIFFFKIKWGVGAQVFTCWQASIKQYYLFKEMVTSENKERFLNLGRSCLEGKVDAVANLLRDDPNLIKCKVEETGEIISFNKRN